MGEEVWVMQSPERGLCIFISYDVIVHDILAVSKHLCEWHAAPYGLMKARRPLVSLGGG
jgi:hypothetical protein